MLNSKEATRGKALEISEFPKIRGTTVGSWKRPAIERSDQYRSVGDSRQPLLSVPMDADAIAAKERSAAKPQSNIVPRVKAEEWTAVEGRRQDQCWIPLPNIPLPVPVQVVLPGRTLPVRRIFDKLSNSDGVQCMERQTSRGKPVETP